MNQLDTVLEAEQVTFGTPARAPQAPANPPSLRDSVEHAVNNYFEHLDGQQASGVYNMVLAEIETPLLEVVMKQCRHNQTRASQVLGLNRGTLRKKLKQYGLL